MRISNPLPTSTAHRVANEKPVTAALWHGGNLTFDRAETFCTRNGGAGNKQPGVVRALELFQDTRVPTPAGTLHGRRGDFIAENLHDPNQVLVFKREDFLGAYVSLSERLPTARQVGETRPFAADGPRTVTTFSARQQGHVSAEDFIRMATWPRSNAAPHVDWPTLVLDLADAPSSVKERNPPLKMTSGDVGRLTVGAASSESQGGAAGAAEIFNADVTVERAREQGETVKRTVSFAKPYHGLKDAQTLAALVGVVEAKMRATQAGVPASVPVRLILRDENGLQGTTFSVALDMREKWAGHTLGASQADCDKQMEASWEQRCRECFAGYSMPLPPSQRALLAEYVQMLAGKPVEHAPAAASAPVPQPPAVMARQPKEPLVHMPPLPDIPGRRYVTSLQVGEQAPAEAHAIRQVQRAPWKPVGPYVTKIQIREASPPGTFVTIKQVLDAENKKR
jgi:hypothetical protein